MYIFVFVCVCVCVCVCVTFSIFLSVKRGSSYRFLKYCCCPELLITGHTPKYGDQYFTHLLTLSFFETLTMEASDKLSILFLLHKKSSNLVNHTFK